MAWDGVRQLADFGLPFLFLTDWLERLRSVGTVDVFSLLMVLHWPRSPS